MSDLDSHFSNTAINYFLVHFQFFIYSSKSSQINFRFMESALQLVAGTQAYQNRVLIIIALFWSSLTTQVLLNAIVFTNPKIICPSSPFPATQAQACSVQFSSESQCFYQNSQTGTYQANLYCQNAGIRVLIQSIVSLGCIVGKFSIGFIADIKGRKFSLQLCLIFGIIGLLLDAYGIYFQAYATIIIGQFLTGFSQFSLLSLNSLLIQEFFSYNPKFQQKALALSFVAWGAWQATIGFISLLRFNWATYLFAIALSSTAISLYSVWKYMLRSPFYVCFIEKDKNQTKDIIEMIGRFNNVSEKEIGQACRIIDSIKPAFEEKTGLMDVYSAMISDRKNIKMFITLTLIYMSYLLQFYAIMSFFERFSQSQPITIICVGIGQVIFNYITSFLLAFNRKKSLAVGTLLMVIIGMLFFLSSISQNFIISTFLLFILVGVECFQVICWYLIPMQYFRIEYASIAMALISGTAVLGRFLAPIVVHFANQHEINAIGLTSLLIFFSGFIPCFFLEQTKRTSASRQKLMSDDEVLIHSTHVALDHRITDLSR